MASMPVPASGGPALCDGPPSSFASGYLGSSANFKRVLRMGFDRRNQFDVIDEILNSRNIGHRSRGWERQLGSGVAAKSNNAALHLCRDRSKAKAAKFVYAICNQILDFLA